ncbi:MAG TPA: hypothetical protein VF700_13125, partial [Segetibacter sp.]
MKKIFLALALLVSTALMAQNDTLRSGVYSSKSIKSEVAGKVERRKLLHGSTLDLANLEIHSSTLLSGETNHRPKATMDAEELIIIKEGTAKATVEDSTKTLGPGGLILLLAGDKQS